MSHMLYIVYVYLIIIHHNDENDSPYFFMDFHSHYLSVTADASIWLGKIHLPQVTLKRPYSIGKFCLGTIRITKMWTDDIGLVITNK